MLRNENIRKQNVYILYLLQNIMTGEISVTVRPKIRHNRQKQHQQGILPQRTYINTSASLVGTAPL